MIRKNKILLLLCSVMALAFSANADELLSLKLGYMTLSPSGDFAGEVGGVGTRIDLDNDLGFDDSQKGMAEIGINLGNSHFSAAYVPLSFSGSGTLTRNITFNGQTFNASDAATSELSADIYDLGYTYYLINMDDLPSRFQFGIEAAVKITQADASITDLTLSQSESVSETVPIPTLGVRAQLGLADFLGLSGRVGYMGYAGNHFLDADARLEYSPLPAVGVFGGYRSIQLKIDSSGLFVDTTFRGPYAGGFFRF